MQATVHRLEFAPPPTRGSAPAFVLAVLAHLLLLGALAWGVSWKHQVVTLTAEAELWSDLPQTAAPRLIESPPPPEPVPQPPPPVPVPEPIVVPKVIEVPPAPTPVAPIAPDADIAIQQEKQRLAKEKQAREQALLDKKIQLEKAARLEKAEKLAAEKKRAEQQRELDRKMAADRQRAAQQLADQKQAALKAAQQKQAANAAQIAQEDARKVELQRQENIKRMAGLAGASGSTASTGTALQSSGPSAGYAGRIRARIKPNIVFTEDIAGNPNAEVEVRTSPDGTILSRRLVTASGVPSWDEAVLKAIDKSQTLPRDVDGRVPPSLLISFRPKD